MMIYENFSAAVNGVRIPWVLQQDLLLRCILVTIRMLEGPGLIDDLLAVSLVLRPFVR